MKSYRNLYSQLCSYENLELAFKRARKRKTMKEYVIGFEADLENNLKQLKHELESFTYCPRPLTTFAIKDPKTRKINASHFRDRVVHHALCIIIEPIFEKSFIHDSFANQKGKGTHAAIRRFEKFLRKVSRNGKPVVLAKVHKADSGSFHTFGGVIYVRIGSTTRRLEGPTMVEFLKNRQILCFDELGSRATMEDVEEKRVRHYLSVCGKEDYLAVHTPKEFLLSLNLASET